MARLIRDILITTEKPVLQSVPKPERLHQLKQRVRQAVASPSQLLARRTGETKEQARQDLMKRFRLR